MTEGRGESDTRLDVSWHGHGDGDALIRESRENTHTNTNIVKITVNVNYSHSNKKLHSLSLMIEDRTVKFLVGTSESVFDCRLCAIP